MRLPSEAGAWYINYMNRIAIGAPGTRRCAAGVAFLLVLLCVCVVTQMLGAPLTLLSLLNSDMLAQSEPISEDLSAFSPSLEPERPRLVQLLTEFRPLIHLPTLRTSVFHPPSA